MDTSIVNIISKNFEELDFQDVRTCEWAARFVVAQNYEKKSATEVKKSLFHYVHRKITLCITETGEIQGHQGCENWENVSIVREIVKDCQSPSSPNLSPSDYFYGDMLKKKFFN